MFVDLKKTFDTADHGILLKKLSHYEIRGIANEWFCSYLTKRKQYVIIGNKVSALNEISTGVPQGSVLRTLLFLIYINDLHKCIKYSKIYHSVDDTSIIQSHSSMQILSKHINKDLSNLSNWLKTNKFKIDGKRLIPTLVKKHATIQNHLQPAKTIQNHPQPTKTTHKQSKPAKTIENHPKHSKTSRV